MYEFSTKMPVLNENIVYPELSYKIVGVLFDVYNELGFGMSEIYYQKAIAMRFKEERLKFQEQVYTPIIFQNKVIGKQFLDFLIEDKIILEIKNNSRFTKKNIEQVNGYLRSTGNKLALLVNFDSDGVKFKRLVNL